MVIIKIKANLAAEDINKVIQSIHAQAAMGVIVLPNYCELLNEAPADKTIKVVCEQEPDSEKERMGKEFRRRLMQKICSTCAERHAPASQSACWACSTGSLYRKE